MSQFQKVLDDIQLTDTELTHVIADNPKRAFVRNSLCHGARFACEYCYAQGIALNKTPEILQEIDIILYFITVFVELSL